MANSLKRQIVLDYGVSSEHELISTIDDLARCAEYNYAQHPDIVTLAQSATAGQLIRNGIIPPHQLITIQVGQAATNGTKGGGTYHVLGAAYDILALSGYLDSVDVSKPIQIGLVAHQLHVPRAIKQGRLFNMELIPMEQLPDRLYDYADQWWCRSKPFWYIREIIGYVPLKMAGQL